MVRTPTPADDHRARRLLARLPRAARVTAAVVLAGLSAAACGTVHAEALSPLAVAPSMIATATAAMPLAATVSPKATAKHSAKPSTSPSPTVKPSSDPKSAGATGTPTTSASAVPSDTPPPAPPPTQPASSSGCQQSFVPSYFYASNYWDEAIGTNPTPPVMFLNVDSGPGTGPDSHFQQLVKSAQQHGITVLGYSSTEYTAKSISAVETEVADYKNWYGVNGMMLDLTQGTSGALSYYQTLYNYIHSEISGAVIWLNVGSYPVSSFMNVANVIMGFEGSYSSFQGSSVPSWVSGYARDRFAQVIYDTPAADVAAAASTAWSRRAGYLFTTDLGEPNPYGALPSYWSAEAATVAAQC
jgi:Spherulation-specific family 4